MLEVALIATAFYGEYEVGKDQFHRPERQGQLHSP